MNASGNNNRMETTETTPKLIGLHKWLTQIGVTNTTGWRWRKKGLIRTINIYGRLYLSDEAIAEFHRRANAGEFAIEMKPATKATSRRSRFSSKENISATAGGSVHA